MEDFLPMMIRNAKDSLHIEEGCLQFDVLKVENDPSQIWLYEIYTNDDAFTQHCRMPHFLRFDAESTLLVERKTVIRGRLHSS